MQDNKKGFTESANSVKPNDESFAEKMHRLHEDYRNGKKSLNEIRIAIDMDPIDDEGMNRYVKVIS